MHKVFGAEGAPPLVLVPGIQGRWEYMRPAIDALSASFRVLTGALTGEPDAGAASDPGAGLDAEAALVLRAIDADRVDRAIVVGVSFGGLVALRFAASHPERTSALVLASTPGPGWRLKPRHLLYTRAPWLFGPLFLAEAPLRLHAEIRTALPGWRSRAAFSLAGLRTLVTAPLSLRRLAARAQLISSYDAAPDCRRIAAPTLIVTGEPELDHVVPAGGSSEYARLIPGAWHAVIPGTGHLGTITKPGAFASIVSDFAHRVRHAA